MLKLRNLLFALFLLVSSLVKQASSSPIPDRSLNFFNDNSLNNNSEFFSRMAEDDMPLVNLFETKEYDSFIQLVENGQRFTAQELSVTHDGLEMLFKAVKDLNAQLIAAIIDADVNVNGFLIENYRNALHFAATYNNLYVIKALIDKGAGVNIPNNLGETALHISAFNGNARVFKYLLKHGANVNARSLSGETALHYSAMHGKIRCVQYLLKHEANVDAKNGEGQTALHYAARYGNFRVLRLLVKYRATVNVQNKYLQTALHGAAYSECLECLKYLIASHAQVDEVSSTGITPLHIAVLRQKLSFVKELMEAGANPNIEDDDRKSALDIAKSLSVGSIHREEILNELNLIRT